MYKRYQGNSGKVVWVEDAPHPPPPPPESPGSEYRPPRRNGPRRPGGRPPGFRPPCMELETEDLLLLLILYLLYRESGDSELLMIIGAMFLL